MIDNPPSVESFVSDQRETCKVFVGSWNVGGVTPPDCLNMDDWLGLCNNECDIYVLGAGNILTPESVGISTKWNSLIQAALNNRRLPTPNNKTQDLKVGEKQKVHPVKDGESRSAVIVPRVFKCIISKQMVGIFISVWVTDDLQPFVRNLSVSCVGCGIMGFLGNKFRLDFAYMDRVFALCVVIWLLEAKKVLKDIGILTLLAYCQGQPLGVALLILICRRRFLIMSMLD
ncbi:hypothetical protein ACLOJK_006967 [Asimina triloba]